MVIMLTSIVQRQLSRPKLRPGKLTESVLARQSKTERFNPRLETGPGLAADLYEDNIVDFLDLKLFVDEWLYYCPLDWPLK